MDDIILIPPDLFSANLNIYLLFLLYFLPICALQPVISMVN